VFHNPENNRTLRKLGLLKNDAPEGGSRSRSPPFEMAPGAQEMSETWSVTYIPVAKNSSSI
jgi:hypothetical protein